MSMITRELTIFLAKTTGKSNQVAIDELGFFDLTVKEMWNRLLRSNKLIQRMFPKTSFLTAFDSPKMVNKHRNKTTVTGPR